MSDPADSLYWARTFPGQASAQWKDFLPIFIKDVQKSPPPHPFLTLDVLLAVAFDVGFPEKPDAIVTADMLAIFIKRFGPLKVCGSKVLENLFSPVSGELLPWFHGSISRQEAEERLRRDLTPGRYLIRFSEAKPDKFTLVLVSAEKKIMNVLISNLGEHGYGLKPDYSACAPSDHFGSIPEFICREHQKLRDPEPSPLYSVYMTEMQVRIRHLTERRQAEAAAAQSLSAAASEMDDPYAVFDPMEAYPAYPTFRAPPTPHDDATSAAFPLTPPADSYATFESTPFAMGNATPSSGVHPAPPDAYAAFETADYSIGSSSTPSTPMMQIDRSSSTEVSAKYRVGSLVDQATHIISLGDAGGYQTALDLLSEALAVLLPLIPAGLFDRPDAHPLMCPTAAADDPWESKDLHGLWVFNCGGLLLLHSGVNLMHSITTEDSPLFAAEVAWDNDASGAVCFPPPSARATDRVSTECGRWKELSLARLLSARGAALSARGMIGQALCMYQKALWVYSTLYAEQDLADLSINDAVSRASSEVMSPSASMLSPASSCYSGGPRCVPYSLVHSLCSVLAQASMLAEKKGEHLLALRYYEEVFARACVIGDWPVRTTASVNLRHTYSAAVEQVGPLEFHITSGNAALFLEEGKGAYRDGKASVATGLLRKALSSARLCGDQEIELKSLYNLATVLKETKQLVEASDLYRQCISLCKTFGKKYSKVEKQGMYEMSKCLIDSGLSERGLEVLDRAIAMAENRQNIETLRDLKDKTEKRLSIEGGKEAW